MDDDRPLLAEFYYYIAGDKTTYNQELNDLHVCYTLTRGLQLHSDRPRRPALPLEIILRVIRHAGFIDPKPDLGLMTEAVMLTMNLRDSGELNVWYMAGPLSRTQLASMARIQLVNIVENPKVEIIPYGTLSEPHTLWAFTPFGADDKRTSGLCGQSILASLYACADESEAREMQSLTPSTVVGHTFGPEHEISRQLDDGRCPYVIVISKQPARVMFWKWWEPRF